MMRVVTVHWQSDQWVEPQLSFFRRHLPADAKVYAALRGVAREHWSAFHYAVDIDGTHPEKLNQLALAAADEASRDDLLVFVDGDAFPVAPIDREVLGASPLAAVRRDENLGDPQPHPSFCVTTVGFWQEIAGDWNPGHRWVNRQGHHVTDTGGNLLGILEARGIEWRPLLRTNRRNLHPLWFGVYGDVAYHHGAGFRERTSRLDGTSSQGAAASVRTPAWVPLAGRVEQSMRVRAATRRRAKWQASAAAESNALSEAVFEVVRGDPEFFRWFTDAVVSSDSPLAELSART